MSITVTDADLAADQFDYIGTAANPSLVIGNGTLFIDQNQDGRILIQGPVVVRGNTHVSLSNQTVYFARDLEANSEDDAYPHSGIVVSQSADLTLNNCIFTNFNGCDFMWEGIKVIGEENPHAVKPKLVLNNSTIENAHTGVNVGEYLSQRSGTDFLFLLNGKLEATNSTFKNNRIAVNFADSYNVDVPSFIKNCTFLCDGLLKDQVRYPGLGSDVFIQLNNTRSLAVHANSFTGFAALPEDQRGTAIRSYNARYNVGSTQVGGLPGNSFTDLTKGLDVYSTGSLANTVRIKANTFSNVVQGITSNGSNFDEIRENTFNVPAGTVLLDSWGMNLYNSSGFLATENQFYTPNGTSANTYGALARNTSLADGELYKNYFHGDFYAATQAEQTNSLLTIKCNEYSGSNAYDWAVTSGSLSVQGVCGGPNDPAGNLFSSCTGNDESQIYKAISVPSFQYRAHTNLQPDANCISTGVVNSPCTYTSTAQTCTPYVALPGIKPKPGGSLSPSEAARQRSIQIRALQDAGNISGLVAFVTNNSLPSDIYLLIPTLLDRSDCATARLKLQSMITTDAEATHFYRLFHVLTVLCEGNRSIHELTPIELQEIQAVSESGTRVSVHAQSILANLENNTYIRRAERTNQQNGMITNGQATIQEATSNLSVYPNPSEGKICIEIKHQNMGNILVSDALGRVQFQAQIPSSEGIYVTDKLTLNLNTGIYFVTFTDDGGTIETKQLFIQH